MSTRKDDGRRIIQLTVNPDLYDQIRAHCSAIDMPITVWARTLIRNELQRLDQPAA